MGECSGVGSDLPVHQALQVLALGETQGRRVVGAGLETLDQVGVDPGVHAGAGDDLLEQLGADAAAARVGGQQAARHEQFERQAVDVLVGAAGALGVRGRGGELGRIEHDGIEGPPILEELAQHGVDVGIQRLMVRGLEAVEQHMLAGAHQRRAGGIDAEHLVGPAGQRRHRKAPCVRVAVQHPAAAELAHPAGEIGAVVALVQVVAGLVALGHVELQAPARLLELHLGGAVATQPAGLLHQTLELAHPGIAAFVEAAQAGGAQQRVGDHALPLLGTAGQELRHQQVGVAVDDQARQTVGLAMHQAHPVAADTCVLVMLACPSSSCTARRSPLDCSR
jgi:hypothetical protein